MEIPLPEIIDKLCIIKLKIERVGEPHLIEELEGYQKALKEFEDRGIKIKQEWIDELYEIHNKIWNLVHDIRKIINFNDVWKEAEKMGLEELGRRQLKVGELMKKRTEIKNKISEESGSGFKEVKINHCAG